MSLYPGDVVRVTNPASLFFGAVGEVYRVESRIVWARVRKGDRETSVGFPLGSLERIPA